MTESPQNAKGNIATSEIISTGPRCDKAARHGDEIVEDVRHHEFDQGNYRAKTKSKKTASTCHIFGPGASGRVESEISTIRQ